MKNPDFKTILITGLLMTVAAWPMSAGGSIGLGYAVGRKRGIAPSLVGASDNTCFLGTGRFRIGYAF